MNPLVFAVVITGGLTIGISNYSKACPLQPEAFATALNSHSYLILFKTDPVDIVVGETFSVELQVCDRSGMPFKGDIKATATMPMHKHGMNYTPSVGALGGGKFRLEGFVLHMQGNWQYAFELESDGQTETVLLDHVQR
jgi:hypothetical protein